MLKIKQNKIWYNIPGFEGYYQMSILNGNIRMINFVEYKKGLIVPIRILQKNISQKYLSLNIKGVSHRVIVHRQYAKMFIDNPKDLRAVKYKDLKTPLINRENLYWAQNKRAVIRKNVFVAKEVFYTKKEKKELIFKVALVICKQNKKFGIRKILRKAQDKVKLFIGETYQTNLNNNFPEFKDLIFPLSSEKNYNILIKKYNEDVIKILTENIKKDE